MSDVFISASDNRLSIEGLQDSRTNAFVSSATVTARVFSKAGDLMTGPLTLAAVTGVPGTYDGIVPLEVPLNLGEFYRVVIYVDAGAGARRTFEKTARVVTG